jgi:hypothetical protein
VVGALAAAADGAMPLSPEQREHVDGCLACQAELVRCRRMLRSLRWLAADVLHPPDVPVAGLVDSVRAAAERRATSPRPGGRRRASLGALAVAAGATAAAVVAAVLTRRHQPAAALRARRPGVVGPVRWS